MAVESFLDNAVPESILPQQFYDLTCRRKELTPDLQIRLEVLVDAVSCFMRGIAKLGEEEKIRAKERRLKGDAEQWIFSDTSEKEEPFVFLFAPTCEALDIHPEYLRNGLRRWQIYKQNGAKLNPVKRRSPVTRTYTIKTSKRSSEPNRKYRQSRRVVAKLSEMAIAQRPEMIASENKEISPVEIAL